jgi:phosphate transport system substrate-binding protein
MRIKQLLPVLAMVASLAFVIGACGEDEEEPASTPGAGAEEQSGGGSELSGTIQIDGSSTVAPLSEAAAELFQQQHPGVRVTVGTSGTGGGFEKFCRGETDISDASRPIEDEEIQACEEQGIAFEELTVANDALSVVVNPNNDWIDCITVEQLNKMWDRGSKIDNWNQIDPSFPDQELQLFGPGTDSGTFDYFTEAINGEEGVSRTNYNNIGEDDNAVITGVGGNEGALGYVPLSFVLENEGAIKPLEVENPESGECVAPSEETVQNATYVPLGRPLFVYPSDKALQKEPVKAFLDFYISNNAEITERATFIPLTEEQKQQAEQKIESLAGGA